MCLTDYEVNREEFMNAKNQLTGELKLKEVKIWKVQAEGRKEESLCCISAAQTVRFTALIPPSEIYACCAICFVVYWKTKTGRSLRPESKPYGFDP